MGHYRIETMNGMDLGRFGDLGDWNQDNAAKVGWAGKVAVDAKTGKLVNAVYFPGSTQYIGPEKDPARFTAAVKEFQLSKGLNADGKLGAGTWAALRGTTPTNRVQTVPPPTAAPPLPEMPPVEESGGFLSNLPWKWIGIGTGAVVLLGGAAAMFMGRSSGLGGFEPMTKERWDDLAKNPGVKRFNTVLKSCADKCKKKANVYDCITKCMDDHGMNKIPGMAGLEGMSQRDKMGACSKRASKGSARKSFMSKCLKK